MKKRQNKYIRQEPSFLVYIMLRFYSRGPEGEITTSICVFIDPYLYLYEQAVSSEALCGQPIMFLILQIGSLKSFIVGIWALILVQILSMCGTRTWEDDSGYRSIWITILLHTVANQVPLGTLQAGDEGNSPLSHSGSPAAVQCHTAYESRDYVYNHHNQLPMIDGGLV